MNCTVDQRRAAHAARDALRECDTIVCADALDGGHDPAGRWSVEFLVDESAAGVPPDALATLARHGLSLPDVTPQHPYRHAVAVVA